MADDFAVKNASGATITKAAKDTTGAGGALADHVITNARRNAGVLHRNAITAADKLAAPGTVTLSGQTGGSLVSATTYYVSVAAYNQWGATTPATVVSTTPGGSNGTLRAAFSQVTNAVGYDVFLSTDSGAPKWVGRVTEAQRAGGIVITAVGTTGAGGAAGAVDIQVPGTGIQTTNAVFSGNNAYTPATPTPINCAGYSRAHVHVKLALTDLRSAPALSLVPFFQDQQSGADWFQGQLLAVPLLGAVGQSLEQDFEIDVDGATNMVILVDTVSGQGAAATVWVELA